MKLILAVLCVVGSLAHAHAESPKSGGLTVLVPTVSVPGAVQNQMGIQPAQLTTLLAQALIKSRVGEVRTEEDIKALLQQNMQQQLLGCVDMGCALDLGRAAGADLLVRGEAGLVGRRLLVSATLINVRDVRVVAIVTRAVSVDQLANGALNGLAMDLLPAALGQPGDAVSGREPSVNPEPNKGLDPNLPAARERVLVAARQWTGVTDAAVRTTALGKAAEVVNAAGGFQAVSSDELKSVLQSEADLQALGSLENGAVQKVADAVKAPYLITLEMGKLGTAFVMGASLVDTRTVEVVNRSSLVFHDVKQLLDAVGVVTKLLLGQQAQLPPPDADPSRLEVRLQAMMNEAMGKYTELPQGGAAGLVVLPYGETSAEARQRRLGTQLATFMHGMAGGTTVALAAQDKVAELKKQHDLDNPLALDPVAFSEVGVFLGAQALMVGTVGDLGTDYLLQVRLVKVVGGQVFWQGTAMFPKAKPGSLLPKKIRISRSRADALTRAVVPGLAQFTSGPLGILKGAAVVFGMVVGVSLAALSAFAIAPLAYSGVFWSQGHAQTGLPVPEPPSPFGADSLLCDPTNGSTAAQVRLCTLTSYFYLGAAGVAAGVLIAALVGAVGIYGLSFVDAAVFGIREETVDFEAI